MISQRLCLFLNMNLLNWFLMLKPTMFIVPVFLRLVVGAPRLFVFAFPLVVAVFLHLEPQFWPDVLDVLLPSVNDPAKQSIQVIHLFKKYMYIQSSAVITWSNIP